MPCGARADLILTGGTIVTLQSWRPGAVFVESEAPTAMAIAAGRVLATGTDDEMAAFHGDHTETIDLAGRSVIPGIIDGHLHFTSFSMAYNGYISVRPGTLDDWADLPNCFDASDVGADGWLRFHGWSTFALGRIATRHEIDEALRMHGLEDTPAVLYDWSGHQLIASTEALSRAGIDAATIAPTGGVIGREDDGTPNGHLGDGAMALVNAAVPPIPREVLRSAYLAGQHTLHALGIVGLTEPGLGPGAPALLDGSCTPEALATMGDLAAEGELTLRITVLALLAGTGGASVDLFRAGLAEGYLDRFRARGLPEDAVRIGGAKIFSDGIPMNHTSWFHEPYGQENDRGSLVVEGSTDRERVEELGALVRLLNENDMQAGIHAIGDAAADAAAQAIADAVDDSGQRDLRHYLIHASVLSEHTIALMGEHRIGWTANPVITRLGRGDGLAAGDAAGRERLRTVLDAGGHPCLVTDSPIVPPDWRPNVVHAVTRSQFYLEGSDREAVTGLDALALVTTMAAWQQHADDRRGRLVPGALADFVVLGGAWPSDEAIAGLVDIPTDLTYVGGARVYARDAR
ncbi:MAG: amidohydrolase family protein [Microbacterium sp.]